MHIDHTTALLDNPDSVAADCDTFRHAATRYTVHTANCPQQAAGQQLHTNIAQSYSLTSATSSRHLMLSVGALQDNILGENSGKPGKIAGIGESDCVHFSGWTRSCGEGSGYRLRTGSACTPQDKGVWPLAA